MSKIEELAERLTKDQVSLGIAESCTGGAMSKSITDIPGSSSFFEGGVVAYSNVAKIEVVGIPLDCLRNHGAVSERTAIAMANGARDTFSSDIGLGITGIAGPGGGTEEKPVGLVYLGLCIKGQVKTKRLNLSGSREKIRERATIALLDWLRRELI